MENALVHHGILGMRWGVRRYQNKDGTLTNTGKARKRNGTKEEYPDHDDHTRVYDKKPPSSMSDTELRSRLNRMQMEQQYSRMSKKKNKIELGNDAVKNAIAIVGTLNLAFATGLTLKNNFGMVKDAIMKYAGEPLTSIVIDRI